jgi:hypothetical protein
MDKLSALLNSRNKIIGSKETDSEVEIDRVNELNEINKKIKLIYFENINYRPIKDLFSFFDIRELKKGSKVSFLGNFYFLSLTDQRDLCKSLGLDYIKKAKFSSIEENREQINVTNTWTNVSAKTKLIVVGGSYEESEIKTKIYNNDLKNIIKKEPPYFERYNIPIIEEAHLIKIHKLYPNITNSTYWDKEHFFI